MRKIALFAVIALAIVALSVPAFAFDAKWNAESIKLSAGSQVSGNAFAIGALGGSSSAIGIASNTSVANATDYSGRRGEKDAVYTNSTQFDYASQKSKGLSLSGALAVSDGFACAKYDETNGNIHIGGLTYGF